MKNKIILTAKHGRPSTKVVYSQMTNDTAQLIHRRQIISTKTKNVIKQYYRIFKNNNVDNMFKQQTVDFNNSIIVRWGTREVIETDNTNIVYNTSKSIENATDKKLSRQIFLDNNVSTPQLVTVDNFRTEYLPIIARPLTHSKGKNFVVLNTNAEFLVHYERNHQSWYYSQFINKEREFRVHCAHGKVLAVMEKTNPNNGNIAWNRAQNDTEPFTYIPWSELDKQKLKTVLVEALKATAAIGLDMSGVDVMLMGKTAFVLEVNTAPTLNTSDYVASRWGMYFDWLFRLGKRREHWDYTQFEKASSLIWKNYQLRDEIKAESDD